MTFPISLKGSPHPSRLPVSASTLAFLVFGLVLGVVAAFLIISGKWQFAVGLVFIVPAAILIFKNPLLAVTIWLLVDPFVLVSDSSTTRIVFWMIHRALPLLTVGVLGITYLVRIRKFPKLELADFAMFGYVLVSLFSIAFLNQTPRATAYVFYDRVFSPMCFYFIIRFAAPGEKEMKQLIPVILFLGITQASIGILSWLAPQLLPHEWLVKEGQRTTGTLSGGYSDYSTTMIFVCLFLLYAALNQRSKLVRFLLISACLLSAFGVFISFSRATWLAGIVVLLALAFLYPKVILPGVIVAVPVVFIITGVVFAGRFYDPTARLNESQTALSRLPTDLAAYRMFEVKPVFGWGYANFKEFDRPFQEGIIGLFVTQQDIALHNLYLQILAEQGVVGLILFLFPVIWWLYRTFQTRRMIPEKGFLSKNLLFLLWLVILDHFIENSFSIMWIGFGYGMYWLSLGLIANIVSQKGANGAAQIEKVQN